MTTNLLALAAIVSIAFLCGFWTCKRLAKPPAVEPAPAPAPEQKLKPTATKLARFWHPMPCATRLELGDTGYWIELVGKPKRHTYQGYDPEGDVISQGPNLKEMKAHLEQQAQYRDEFAPPPSKEDA